MKTKMLAPILALIGGVVGFFLRLLQNRFGFEADTGLPVIGSIWTIALPLFLAALCVLFWFALRSMPRGQETTSFTDCFAGDSPGLTCVVLGALLLLVGGGVQLFRGITTLLSQPEVAISGGGQLVLLSGGSWIGLLLDGLAVICAVCLLAMAKCCKRGDRLSGGLPVAAVACYVVFLVQTYRQSSVNPTLAAYYIEILAAAALVLCFYRLSAFAFQSGRTGRFTFCAMAAIVLCLTALADRRPGALLFYGGSALAALGFLLCRLAGNPNPPLLRDARHLAGGDGAEDSRPAGGTPEEGGEGFDLDFRLSMLLGDEEQAETKEPEKKAEE
ncbi:MAG: hypothetical protein RRY95_07560 [Oscillospiraceae bacterium]